MKTIHFHTHIQKGHTNKRRTLTVVLLLTGVSADLWHYSRKNRTATLECNHTCSEFYGNAIFTFIFLVCTLQPSLCMCLWRGSFNNKPTAAVQSLSLFHVCVKVYCACYCFTTNPHKHANEVTYTHSNISPYKKQHMELQPLGQQSCSSSLKGP